MKYVFCFLIIGLIFSCKNPKQSQEEITEIPTPTFTYEEEQSESETDSTLIYVGYDEELSDLPKLEFNEITSDTYEFIKLTDSLTAQFSEEMDSCYYLMVKGEKVKFEKETNKDYGNRNGTSWTEYEGYYNELKLYALINCSVSENFGFGDFQLLDSITGYRYQIPSMGDGSISTPILSPDSKHMLYFDYEYGAQESCVGILKIGNKRDPRIYITEYKDSESFKDFEIEDAKWITSNSFAIKGFSMQLEENEFVKIYRYYKSEF